MPRYGGNVGHLKAEEFTASGTFLVPAGVTLLWVSGCAGGGGGAVAGSAVC